MNTIDEYLEKHRELKECAKHSGGKIFKDFVEGFMKKSPEILGIRWTQYTPHFNDGETGIFTVNNISIKFSENIIMDCPELKKRGYEVSPGYWNIYDLRGFPVEIEESVEDFRRKFGMLEDFLYDAFGDHAEIIVERNLDSDEISIVVQKHEHD